jgi:hypothetical protein
MRARAGCWISSGCGALLALHAKTLVAAPARGYTGPGAAAHATEVEPTSGEPAAHELVEPRFPIDRTEPPPETPGDPTPPPAESGTPGAADDPGEPGPPATSAAQTEGPGTPPTDLAQVGTRAPETWMPRHRIVYRNLVAGRANPVGFVDEITVGYRYQLVARDTPLFRDTFLLAGAHAFVTPAFVRVGPVVELQPVAVLNLSATYDVVGYYGAFGQAQSYRTPTADAGPDQRRTITSGYPTWGHLVTLSALLQARVRNIAVRNQVKFFWNKVRVRDGDTVLADLANDILAPNNGWVLTNDSDVIWLFEAPFALVARHTLTHAFYTQDLFLPGEPVSDPNGPTSRLGPGVVWTIFDYPGARFNKPALIVLTQWWLRHRWRTGDQLSPALPYAVVGFQFEGDLWKPRERPRDFDDRRRERRRRR